MKYSKRLVKVLRNLADSVENESVDAMTVGRELESMLDELCSQDAFGTEGQLDPRGDWRNRDEFGPSI